MTKREITSAGLLASDLGFVGPTTKTPTGIPAVVIGTSLKGPAFVPIIVGSLTDFYNKFGIANISGSINNQFNNPTTYGPLAAAEWLRNSSALTFVRIMGLGDGKRRIQSGRLAGEVTNAGFTVGEEQPNYTSLAGSLGKNSYANVGGILGRTYFLGCFMSESVGSNTFSSAGLQGTGSINGIVNKAVPIIRGVLMAPSGVVIRLSSSGGSQDSSNPGSTLIATDSTAKGTSLGSISLFDSGGKSLQQFVLLLNGHIGTTKYPNVITASFDIQAPNYITKMLNPSSSLLQEAGHYLAASWDIHPTVATVTGTGVVSANADNPNNTNNVAGVERAIFILTSSLPRDTGSSTVPNYESFRDRFSHSSSPWFVSQKFHNRYTNLFKLHSLDAGINVSNKYKILIYDIVPAAIADEYQYGSFSISIKQIDQLDDDTPALETHTDVNLNPSSPRYISKIIGDVHAYYDFDRLESEQRFVVEGNYELKSNFVRVEVSQEVHDAKIPAQSLPLGFRGISHLVTSGSAPLAQLGGTDAAALTIPNFLRNVVIPPIPLANNIKFNDNASQLRMWGIKFDHITDLNNQNQNTNILFNKSFEAFTSYFPNNSTTNINFLASDNVGTPDTTQLGIIDVDRFCNNFFSIENIKIITGSNGFADTAVGWKNAIYIRNGIISVNDNEKTRRVSINDLRDISSRNYLSFYAIMQGGFDGVNIFDVEERNITNTAVTLDMNFSTRGRRAGPNVCAYLKALEIINNTSAFDMQILAIPGIRHPVITDEATTVAETRFDTLHIMDIEQVNSASQLIEISKLGVDNQISSTNSTVNLFSSRGLNSSFAAAYYPDVTISIPTTIYGIDRIEVPPSVVVLGAISLNDAIGYPWFAPAGSIRGILPGTIAINAKIAELDLNNLYSNNINPLYKYQSSNNKESGIAVYGQKTLQQNNTVLNRINNRRLLLEIRRQARDVALQLLFNQDLQATLASFSSQMNSRLSRIQSLFGLRDYNVKVDASTTTQNDIENNTIRGKIYLRLTKTKEFLSLDFIVSNGLNSEI